MIVNYASSIVNKLEALLTDNARVVIYDHHVFIVQVIGLWSVHQQKTLSDICASDVFVCVCVCVYLCGVLLWCVCVCVCACMV